MTTKTTKSAKKRAQKETDVAFHAYQLYESMGARRSLSKLARALKEDEPQNYTGSIATIERRVTQWAHDHQWHERARDHDKEQEAERRELVERFQREMNDYQARMAQQLSGLIWTRMRDLLQMDQAIVNAGLQAQNAIALGQPVPREVRAMLGTRLGLNVSSKTLGEMWRNLVDVERLARGAATEIAQQTLAGGIALNIIAAAPDGRALPSPFTQDPNDLLAADLASMPHAEEGEEYRPAYTPRDEDDEDMAESEGATDSDDED